MGLTHQTRCLEYTRTVEPGGESLIEVPGSFFRIKEASGPFLVGLDSEPVFAFDLGMAYQCPPSLPFRVLHIQNPGTDPLDITVLVGQGYIIDDRLNVIRERGSLPVIEVPSEASGSGVTLLGPGDSIVLPGTPTGLRIRRKAVLVVNFDLSNPLVILDGAGNAFSACVPGTAWAQHITGPVTVLNNTGGSISCIVGETWYLN